MLLNLSIWLVAGGLLGGLIGAAVGSWIMSPLGGIPGISDGIISLASILIALAGATALLAYVNLFRRRGADPV